MTDSPTSERIAEPAPALEHIVERGATLERVMLLPLWGEHELAIILDVKIDTVRHMKSRGEIPGVVNLNLRKWFVHRDAFLEHIKQRGMPKAPAGRPRGSKSSDD